MTGMDEKNYGDALFELVAEENEDMLKTVQEELSAVDRIFDEVPELIKLSKTPTVAMEDKLSVISDAFRETVSDYTYRFLMVLTESGRLSYFSRICGYFSSLCNERFGIAEITIVSTEEVSDALKSQIKQKMAEITGKTIVLKEETDKSLIGGIVLKYGSRSFDGSVKSRLEALKKEISGVIG